jgi:choline kinase
MTQLDVVVLAAGRGSRLAAIGDDKPKWLLEVAGSTIASRQLAALDLLDDDALRSVTVVTGHAAEALDGVDLGPLATTLYNERFLELNNWYSVLMALRSLPDDARVVIMNGDLCAPPAWIASFFHDCLTTAQEGQLAIDFERTLTEESMKVSVGDAGQLVTIGKHPFPKPVGEYVGLMMASGSVLADFRAQLEAFTADVKDANQWYEGAVGVTAGRSTHWHLWATPGSGWVEIDDLADLAHAQTVASG